MIRFLLCLAVIVVILLTISTVAATRLLTTPPRIVRNADWTPQYETINGVEMALVPAGCFWMGSDEGFEYERPRHVQCVESFYIGRYEVTNADYRACVEAGECTLPKDTIHYNDPADANHPVVFVDWSQAGAYAEWKGLRLPTELEWAFAAAGPDSLRYVWGDAEPTCELLNFGACLGGTAAVGSYPLSASWTGAHDMAGNVWEWTQSVYRPYPYQQAREMEPTDPEDTRTVRGGSFGNNEYSMRIASRGEAVVRGTLDMLGFRVAADRAMVEG